MAWRLIVAGTVVLAQWRMVTIRGLQLSVLWYFGIRRTAAEETGKAVAVFSAPMDSSEQAAAAIPVPCSLFPLLVHIPVYH
jgi:hypothetical protein